MAGDVIRSIKNPTVQRARAVAAGRADGLVLLEGERLIADARASGLAFEALLVAEDLGPTADELARAGLPVARVTRGVLARVSRLKTAPGTLALAREPRACGLDALTDDERALVLVASGLQDPGNLGALARSAEAFGARGLAVLKGGASPWNDKALRGSMGSLLRLPVHRADDADELAAGLAERGVRNVACATRGGASPARFDFGGRVAIWIGAETGELPAVARRFEAVSIPMRGRVESLNATVAAALVLYAAGRAEEA